MSGGLACWSWVGLSIHAYRELAQHLPFERRAVPKLPGSCSELSKTRAGGGEVDDS